MPARRVTEGLHQHLARAVGHRGLLREPRHARDEHQHAEHALDAGEIPQPRPQCRQGVQPAHARGRAPGGHVEVTAEQPAAGEATVEARELAAGLGPAAVHDQRQQWCVRRVRAGQADAQRRQPILDASHPRPPRPVLTPPAAAGAAPAGPQWHWVTAEPLTPEAFAPYGQVVGREAVQLETRGGEELTLDVLHHERRPFRIDHLNRHHLATQTLVPLHSRPACIVVGAPDLTFADPADLHELRAFVLDGSRGLNLAVGTWHEGPWPLLEDLDLVNLQGRDVTWRDNEVAHLERDFGVVVGVRL